MGQLKPRRLKPGDTAGVLSLSWGGPAAYPAIYELGLRNLETHFGLKVVELETARMTDEELYRNPRLRAEVLNRAFRDPSIAAIISSIGGYDSVRVLPFVDQAAMAGNPKILMGYSDTTTVLTLANLLGVVSFYGPSIMAGIAQIGSLPPQFADHLRAILFEDCTGYRYAPYDVWSDWYPDWSEKSPRGRVSAEQPNAERWVWVQGSGTVEGRLWGGCLEVLEFLKGTSFWPERDFWNGRVLFFETSEDKPGVRQVVYMLRSHGVAGLFDRVSAVLVGRAKSYTAEEKRELYEALRRTIGEEFARPDLPIVANMDFGHTDPKIVLPLGARVRIDCAARAITIVESFTVRGE